jgi:hypothetical protein
MPKNWRTDLQGALVVLGAVTAFASSWVSHGMPDGTAWATLWAGVMAGVGLIRSADGAALAQVATAVAAAPPAK